MRLPHLGLRTLADVGSGSQYTAEAKAYFAAMTTQGDEIYKKWINTFVKMLKGKNTNQLNVFNALDDIRLYANKDEDASYINIISPTDTKAEAVGVAADGMKFTAYQGWNAQAKAGCCVNLKTTLQSKANYAQNSACLFIYTRTDYSTTTYDLGTNYSVYSMMGFSSPNIRSYINTQSSTGRDMGNNSTKGLVLVQRTGETTGQLYKNGSKVGSDVTIGSSIAITAGAMVSNARSTNNDINNPTVELQSSRELALVGYGRNLSAFENAALSECVMWLLTNTPAGDKR